MQIFDIIHRSFPLAAKLFDRKGIYIDVGRIGQSQGEYLAS